MRTFCITLPESPQREDDARKHFEEHGIDVEFITGIYAARAGIKTQFPYDVDDKSGNFNMGDHCVGIWLSHYMAWNVMAHQPDDHFLMLEIDAKFDSDWKERVDQALKDVPKDFDFLFIGSCCTGGKPTEKIKGQVFEVKYPMCLHAYIVARKCLPFLLNHARKCWSPVDIMLPMELFPHLKVYTLLPRAVHQFNTEIPE